MGFSFASPSIDCGQRIQIGRKERKMKSAAKIITTSAAALLGFTLAAMATPAAASPGEYCRVDSGSGGMLQCGFSTMEQCQAMVAGRSGYCQRDPFYDSTRSAYAYQPERANSRRGPRPVNGPVE
jgi:hypothetical protein